jgi:hypothetical protein
MSASTAEKSTRIVRPRNRCDEPEHDDRKQAEASPRALRAAALERKRPEHDVDNQPEDLHR